MSAPTTHPSTIPAITADIIPDIARSLNPSPRRTSLETLRAVVLAGVLVAGVLGVEGLTRPADAQIREVPESMRANIPPRQKLSGPRFGLTTFTGDVARMRDQAGYGPVMSQFGWQFENQIVSTETGHQALMEFVLLFGGFERDKRNMSLSWLAGFRLPNGFELGVGPNFGVQLHDEGGTTTSIVTAVGATMPFGEIYVPANIAVAWAAGGPRITTLLGWIIGG